MDKPRLSRATPVLFVDAIEPSLPFWQAVGFEVTMRVPEDGTAGFAILSDGNIELMYQTRASLQEDLPEVATRTSGHRSFLYVEVPDLDALTAAIGAREVFQARRRTFYGATEIGVVEPGGHFVIFAQFDQD